jgi:hypothetical protein
MSNVPAGSFVALLEAPYGDLGDALGLWGRRVDLVVLLPHIGAGQGGVAAIGELHFSVSVVRCNSQTVSERTAEN